MKRANFSVSLNIELVALSNSQPESDMGVIVQLESKVKDIVLCLPNANRKPVYFKVKKRAAVGGRNE